MKKKNLILIAMVVTAIIGMSGLNFFHSYNMKSHAEENSYKRHGYLEGYYGPVGVGGDGPPDLPENVKTEFSEKTE